jgi:hypothetical protein
LLKIVVAAMAEELDPENGTEQFADNEENFHDASAARSESRLVGKLGKIEAEIVIRLHNFDDFLCSTLMHFVQMVVC